jgi:hypothetical protein
MPRDAEVMLARIYTGAFGTFEVLEVAGYLFWPL